jgi:hypothetical protein
VRALGRMAEDGDPFDTDPTHISHKRDPFESFGLDAPQSGTRAGPNGRSSSQRGKHTPLPVVDDPSDEEGEVYFLRCTDRYPGWANAAHRRLAVAAAFALVVGVAGLRLWQLRKADSAVPHPSRMVHHRSRVPPLGAPPPPGPAPNALPSGVASPSSSDDEDGDYQFWRTPPSPPSRRPPPPPPSPPPLPSVDVPATMPSHVELINARFRRDPYASWSTVPSAGVLLHCLDGYEDHSQPWLPGTAVWSKSPLASAPARLLRLPRARLASSGSLVQLPGRGPATGSSATASGARAIRQQKAADSTAFDHPGTDRAEISASVIFASQRIPEAKNTIPTFGCNNGGVIFRPGVTRVLCGAPGDCGGTCHTFCDAPSGGSRSSQRDQFPGDDCRFNGQPATGLHAWRTTNIGSFLRRVAEFQQAAKRSFYNEIVVDPKLWRSRPERAVEAIFVDGTPNGFGEEPEVNEEVASLHRQFLAEFGLSAELNPLLLLDRSNWDSPFRNLSSAAVRR